MYQSQAQEAQASAAPEGEPVAEEPATSPDEEEVVEADYEIVEDEK
jgi:hypothetical protein